MKVFRQLSIFLFNGHLASTCIYSMNRQGISSLTNRKSWLARIKIVKDLLRVQAFSGIYLHG